ncbi:hypothetical protein TrRE_jg2766 [Triparma retinervis]|uniref:Uncharacterized protein n=1 Tax=Triparma retinervis TaxID=2557542 RepID=A0A9W7F8I5_9STRA|nr:hypothetical protein TrRE_jg2766 [Triparma retinervis]
MSEANVAPAAPNPNPNGLTGPVKVLLISVLVGMLVYIIMLFSSLGDTIDIRLEEMGSFKEPYIAMCITAVVYFLGGRVVAKHGKKWRKIAKVPRMNQQWYQTETGTPVFMAYEGAEGRFNRAQRAGYNWQETICQEYVQLFLCCACIGYYAVAFAGMQAVGYVLMARGYTEATHKRILGVLIASIGRYATLVMVIGLIVKGLSV